MRVLLVGPDDDARRDLHLSLDRLDHEVAALGDIDAARRWLAANDCDLVVGTGEHVAALAIDRDRAPGAAGAQVAVVRARDLASAMPLLAARDHAPPPAPIALVGDGAAMRRLRATIAQVGATRTTALVLGESGTGKELVARAIHEASPRRERRFVAINCAAIPATLLESELFGHVRGAFTDAVRDRAGLFEDADGGTLFLDEVGEIPLALQAKLLRVLQDSEIRRVGDTAAIKVDVRLIAATLRDLPADVAAGRFREDLYYRLHVVPVHVPPLRERDDDIPQLAAYFIAMHGTRHARPRDLAGDAIELLRGQPWPGNVRELENVIERAVVLCEHHTIDAEFLASVMKAPAAASGDLAELSIKKATRRLEEDLIAKALVATGGNRTNAAKLLEISHRALLYKMKEYGIS